MKKIPKENCITELKTIKISEKKCMKELDANKKPRENCIQEMKSIKVPKTRCITELKTSKKAQMKIQQMAFMIIAVFLFLGFIGMMVISVMMNNIKDDVTTMREQNAKLLVSKLANSPEFSCGETFGNQKTDCIDMDKVMMLKENMQMYTGFWKVSNIEIRKIYPRTIPYKEIPCTLSNYPECNYVKIMDKPTTDDIGEANYVALCRKVKYNDEAVNKCEIGQLIVRFEAVKE